MKIINEYTIEEWLFEYTEGMLSPSEQKELMEYLENNPRYKEDLTLWTMSFIKAPLPDTSIQRFIIRENFLKIHANKIWISIISFCIVFATMFYLKNNEHPSKKTYGLKNTPDNGKHLRVNQTISQIPDTFIVKPLEKNKQELKLKSNTKNYIQ